MNKVIAAILAALFAIGTASMAIAGDKEKDKKETKEQSK